MSCDSFYLSDISERDKPWDVHRAQSDEVRDLYNAEGYFQYADHINECASWLAFVLGAADDGERRFRLQQARFCRHRHCPTCQWRRSMTWKARFLKALPEIDRAHPTARWVLLTLTVKNCPMGELKGTIAHMNRSFIRLTRIEKYPALGWIKSLEVTKEKRDDLLLYGHPHFHVLMLVEPSYFNGRNYIKQEKWRDMWQHCLQVDYDPIVDVRTIKLAGKKREQSYPKTAIESAIAETLKYTVKPGDLASDAKWLSALTEQLYRVRAIGIGGCLKGYLSEHDPTNKEMQQGEEGEDEPEVEENDPWFDFFWTEKVKRYRGKAREYNFQTNKGK